MSDEQLHRSSSRATGLPLSADRRASGRTRCASARRSKIAAGDLGADAVLDSRTARGVPRRREHLSLDVPDARRARSAGRNGRARGGPAAQRARAAPRAGAAARRRLPAGSPVRDRAGGESSLLLGRGLVVGTVCALVAIAPAAADRGARLPLTAAELAAAACGARGRTGIVRDRDAGRVAGPARWSACGRSDRPMDERFHHEAYDDSMPTKYLRGFVSS